ncbi:MAG: antibiotic biosynthesis monooxygenase [Rhodobacteraceae bacterium]|nr:antibiotic biosynthesis monooxygenase [Paracoccaceae bacterium]
MIQECVELAVKPGAEAAFEAAVAAALPIFRRARGFRGAELHRVIETPGHYRMLINWETLEDHTVHFRGGPDFAAWRALVGPHFAAPPAVTHATLAARFTAA